MARVRCLNAALAILQPFMKNADLIAQFMTYRVVIAEQVEAGKMTIAQGAASIAQKFSEIVAEDQARGLAGRAVAAQEQNAQAAQTVANTTMPVGMQIIANGLALTR